MFVNLQEWKDSACRKRDRLPYWPPRGRQVLHQRWIWGIHCAQARKHTSEGSSPEVQNRGISGPTKRTHVLQKYMKKKNGRIVSQDNHSEYQVWRYDTQWFDFESQEKDRDRSTERQWDRENCISHKVNINIKSFIQFLFGEERIKVIFFRCIP